MPTLDALLHSTALDRLRPVIDSLQQQRLVHLWNARQRAGNAEWAELGAAALIAAGHVASAAWPKIARMNEPSNPSAADRPPEVAALPDRLSVDPRSPHHVAAAFERDVGIRFNGRERHDVSEYCISEGWVRVPAGKSLDRKGNPLLIKLKGAVEAFYK